MRIAYFIGFLACCGLLGYAYYLQHVQFLDPCPLCIFQRIAFFGMAALFLLGAIHDPDGWGGRTYAMLISLAGLLGAALAGRHAYLQSLPPDQVPECGPGLTYMLDTLPFTEVLGRVLSGSGECAEVAWTFLGLSMPWWTLIWFVGLTGWALLFGWKSTRRHIFLD
ncbi:MAG: disulfide bond formation protein B [Xanthomonadales bacterium]|nr:disulfide bond formation protein B [Xanthomonadales bacterium]